MTKPKQLWAAGSNVTLYIVIISYKVV